MKKEQHTLLTILNSLYASRWRETLLAGMSALLGVFTGPIIEQFASPIFQPPYLPVITFILIAALFLVSTTLSLTMWRATNEQIASIEHHANKLADSIGQRIQILPYAKGYKALQKWTEAARNEILILSNYVFDWENDRPIYDTNRLQSPERKAAYMATETKLRSEKKKGRSFKFVRIVQIPKGYRLEAVFPHDPLYYEACKFLAELGNAEPEFASLRTSEVVFHNSFVIIDKTFLYMEFEIRKPDTNQTFAPFVMIVEDPNAEIVQTMRKLHQRIEANSTLITHVD